MIERRHQNIMNSKSIKDWEFRGDYDYLEKTFEFASFEVAQQFIREVGAYCEQNDHHPEGQS